MKNTNSVLENIKASDIETIMTLLSTIRSSRPQVSKKYLNEFKTEYEKYIELNFSLAYLKSVKLSLNHLISFMGEAFILSDLDVKKTDQFISFLKGKAKRGFRVYFRNLKAAFTKAKDWGYIEENPFIKIRLPKANELKPATLNKEEIGIILSKLESTVVKDIVEFTFYTGCRVSEVINLTWDCINIDEKLMTIGNGTFVTKGRNQRIIPLPARAMEILERNRNNGSDYVFIKQNGSKYSSDYISKQFKKACRKANIAENIHFHSLRHSYASMLARNGVSLYTISALLGHSSITTTQIYSHLNNESLFRAIETINQSQII